MFTGFLIFFLFIASPLWAWTAIPGAATCTGGGTSSSVTTAAINTTGATLFVINGGGVSGEGGAFSNNGTSNTYTQILSHIANGGINILSFVSNPNTSSSQTFTFSGSAGLFPNVCIEAFSGNASSPLDQFNVGTSASGNVVTTGSITPSVNNELLVSAGQGGIPQTVSCNSGFTCINGGANGNGIGYLIQTTATPENVTWTWSSGSGSTSGVIASFFPPSTSNNIISGATKNGTIE